MAASSNLEDSELSTKGNLQRRAAAAAAAASLRSPNIAGQREVRRG
uniref:Uncharacterized protein n=1 Tax=Rhizophora mucronata TaxID=61149 RepID=A0A2P2J7C7_RHIMU